MMKWEMRLREDLDFAICSAISVLIEIMAAKISLQMQARFSMQIHLCLEHIIHKNIMTNCQLCGPRHVSSLSDTVYPGCCIVV